MMKNNIINFSLLKTMLKTSYDTSNIIDNDTKRLNKKSMKVWLTGLVCIIVIYLSYVIVNSLKEVGNQAIFLELFFVVLQVLVMFQTILLTISVLYFSDDIKNYLYLPIHSMKLLITKFIVMMSIIFGSEGVLAAPSIFIYGVRNLSSIWFYAIAIIVLATVSIFLSTIVSIVMIFVMRIFRFIKNKYIYKNIVILVMTLIILAPLMNILNIANYSNEKTIESDIYTEQDSEVEGLEELKLVSEALKNTNKYFIVTELGVNALSEINYNSIIYITEILGLDLLALFIFFTIGKFTYIKDVLWNLSIFDKKNKNKKIRFKRVYKSKNKEYAYLKNEIDGVIKNSTYFMHYIYNILIILSIIVLIAMAIVPIFKQVILETLGEEAFSKFSFGFSEFSLIIGIIQVLFTLSSLSLTAISRYGKNAIFFKYIPIKFKTQFRLKNIPQLIMNTIIIVTILGTIKHLIPEISNGYILLMFIVAMLLNAINSNILLLLDLLRPSLNYENEISVIKQNDNKLFQYILTTVSCFIIWYLKEITEKLNLNISILIEIVVFSIIVIGMEIFINKKNNKLFKKII